MSPSANGGVRVTVHNTTPGCPYLLWSANSLASSGWTVDTTFAGASGQDFTLVDVATLNRPMLLFRAIQIGYSTELSFQGIDYPDSNLNPPDSMGAIGPNHFVKIVNGWVAVFERSGVRMD